MELNTNTCIEIGLAVVILQLATAFKIRCPDVSERHLRSKAWCPNAHKYTCLYDENQHSYNESCSVKFDFQRPGYRVTLRTNLNAEACLGNLYQPFIFYNNKSSNCELKKSVCRDEGQIVSTNGTILTDRQCRCNYAHGYTYVTKPKNICSCVPSVEDCSCFRKRCSNHSHILSPDYLCIDKVRWSGKFRCSSVQELLVTTMAISRERQKTKERHRTLIRKHQSIKIAIVATLVGLLICSTFTIWKEDAEYGAIEQNDDNNALMHDKEKIQDFDQKPKIQGKVNEESQRIPEYKEHAAIHQKVDNKSSLHVNEKIQDFEQESKIQGNVDLETLRIPELGEHASIELKNDNNSTLHDEEQIKDFEQEPKPQEKVDEENRRISELDENAAIAPKDENNFTLHDKEQMQDYEQELKMQKNVDVETQRIPELDEHAAIEQKDDNNASLYDKEKIQDFDQEHKIQGNVDEETQRIPEFNELASIHPNDGNSSKLHDTEKIIDFEKEPKIQESVEEENQTISELDEDIYKSMDTKEWEDDIEPISEADFIRFTNTIMKNLVSNNYIILHGEPDCGKSTLFRKIVLDLESRLGCTFGQCIDPSEIINQHCEKASKAFVVHDIFGKFVFSFDQLIKRKLEKLKQQLKDGKVMLLMTCSSAMFMTETVQTLSLFTDNAFELPTSNLSASTDENKTLTDLTGWVKEMRDSNPSAFYSLFFCILNKGYIDIASLTTEGGNLFTAFSMFSDDVLNSLNITISLDTLLTDLHFLMISFIKKENGTFSIQHSSIFNGLAGYFGQELQPLFIKHADPDIIKHHCCLTSCPVSKVKEMFCIQVNAENEKKYFKRIIDQLILRNFSKVFSVRQMKFKSYQMKLVYFLKVLPKESLNQLCSFKCRFEGETMLQLASDYRCIKLATFLRDEMCKISMPHQSGHQHQLAVV